MDTELEKPKWGVAFIPIKNSTSELRKGGLLLQIRVSLIGNCGSSNVPQRQNYSFSSLSDLLTTHTFPPTGFQVFCIHVILMLLKTYECTFSDF